MAWRKCDCEGNCKWPYTDPCKIDTARERSKADVRATRTRRVKAEQAAATKEEPK